MVRWFSFRMWLWLVPASALAQSIDSTVLPAVDPWRFLTLQRSRALLAQSTRANPIPVRILFYGQSITRQEWWLMVADELRRLYPEANLVIENRAISSFNARYLIKTAEADVFPFRPDLILFHCYGPYGPGEEWERLLRSFRARTTADVILLGNHLLDFTEVFEAMPPAPVAVNSQAWLNELVAPGLCQELGFCYPDNRAAWKAYLKSQFLDATALLEDRIHLNLRGSELQFAILKPFLNGPRFLNGPDPLNSGRVRTFPVGQQGLDWHDGLLRLEFEGNRIDALAAPGQLRHCRVRIDGQRPSDLPSGGGHTQASRWSWEPNYWPALLRIRNQSRLLEERWNLTVESRDSDRTGVFEFSVIGTRTGFDGRGSSTHRFVSNSGRVVIEPEDWLDRFPPGEPHVGSQVVWTSEFRSVDDYIPGWNRSAEPEASVTLIQDLPDGPHVLEMIADAPDDRPPVAALRVYHPAGLSYGADRESQGRPKVQLLPLPDGFLTVWGITAEPQSLTFGSELSEPSAVLPTSSAYGFEGARVVTDRSRGFFRLEAVEPQLILRSDLGRSGSTLGDGEVRYGVRGKLISTEGSPGFLQLEKKELRADR